MRVLVLCEYASLNGGERSLLEVAKRLLTEGIELVIAAPRAGPLAEILHQLGLPHVPFDVVDGESQRPPRTVLRHRIAQLIKQTAATLVHANSVSMSRLSGPVVRQLSVPSLGHLRDIVGLSQASLADLSDHRRLLAVSAATRDWYVSAGLSPAKIRVQYNGVDLQQFCPRPLRGFLHQEQQIPSHCLLVGTVGQIGMRKGMDVFVRAAAVVAERRHDVHFLIVGQRYSQKDEAVIFERDLRAAASQGDLGGRLHFLGVRNDVDRHFERTDTLRSRRAAGALGTRVAGSRSVGQRNRRHERRRNGGDLSAKCCGRCRSCLLIRPPPWPTPCSRYWPMTPSEPG